ncbi:MAG: hypothetical protein GF390_02195 [Candidatus Pacebacteria bacterium]|nr:hypothetical protein [Candidatus Paceibacterota bacterium]
MQIISMKELRENFTPIKKGLRKGKSYLLIYRSKPLAKIIPHQGSTTSKSPAENTKAAKPMTQQPSKQPVRPETAQIKPPTPPTHLRPTPFEQTKQASETSQSTKQTQTKTTDQSSKPASSSLSNKQTSATTEALKQALLKNQQQQQSAQKTTQQAKTPANTQPAATRLKPPQPPTSVKQFNLKRVLVP